MTGGREKIIINADPEIADLIPRYLENREKDIVRVREAFGKGDYEAMGFIGHKMRGSGDGYGFQGLSAIGQLLEKAAKEHDPEGIQVQIDELVNYMERIEVIYR